MHRVSMPGRIRIYMDFLALKPETAVANSVRVRRQGEITETERFLLPASMQPGSAKDIHLPIRAPNDGS